MMLLSGCLNATYRGRDSRIAYDTTGGHMHGAGHESVETNCRPRGAVDACEGIAWTIEDEEEDASIHALINA